MSSTDIVKYGNRPEMLFKVTLSPDGTTYQKEISLVFPKFVSADMPHYKEEYMGQDSTASDNCQWHFDVEE
ncbi:hypothetical protein [Methanolobus sp. WCC4]|uniref:hypothetical protein n=1 Tax=Methanolobus sp. WCC4 TaxID=3125784 RepID=UPI0030F625AE